MGKIAKCVNKINFTMLYGNYCYIIIENLPQKFSPCSLVFKNVKLVNENWSAVKCVIQVSQNKHQV